MKILAIADDEAAVLGEETKRAKIGPVDLVVSCGDLSPEYLSFIATLYGAPLFYVRGNHDRKIDSAAELGENLHNHFLTYHGVKFLGFEGSPSYTAKAVQYQEAEMNFLVNQAIFKSWFLGKPDIIAAHAAPQGIHDGTDHAHRGFPAFNKAIAYLKPKYFLHGHNHLRYTPLCQSRVTRSGDTFVINVYGYYVINL